MLLSARNRSRNRVSDSVKCYANTMLAIDRSPVEHLANTAMDLEIAPDLVDLAAAITAPDPAAHIHSG